MKKFNFSLQKILEIKSQVLDNLKMELNNINQQITAEENEIINLNKKYKEINNKFNTKTSVAMTVGEITYYKIYMVNVLKKIESKKEEVVVLNKKAESKRHEILNMNMEISSLEKLKEKEYEEYKYISMKDEENFINEFVSNKKLVKQYMF